MTYAIPCYGTCLGIVFGIKSSRTNATLQGHALRDHVCLQSRSQTEGSSVRKSNSGGHADAMLPQTLSTCVNMGILAADAESEHPFVDLPFDGILGLAPPRQRSPEQMAEAPVSEDFLGK